MSDSNRPLVRWLRTALGDLNGIDKSLGENDVSADGGKQSVTLYQCTGCETAYIDTEMDTCTKCGDSAEETPNTPISINS